MPMQLRNRHSFRRSSRDGSSSRGFTLVEILTATAIMALLVSLVMTILSQVVMAWNRSSDELDIGGKARTTLDLLAADLQTAIFHKDGTQWLSATEEQTPNSPVNGVKNTRLIFFTSTLVHQSKDSSSGGGKQAQPLYGDICAVEYRVVYADPFGNADSTEKTFSLHRVVIDPASTFYGVNTSPIMGVYNGSNRTKNTLEDNFDAVVDINDKPVKNQMIGNLGKNLQVSIYGSLAPESILLDNVARFNVFLYYYGPNTANPPPTVQLYPQTYPDNMIPAKYYFGGIQRNSTGKVKSYLDTQPTFTRLAFADITMTVLKDDGVTLLNQFNGSMPQNMTWEDFLNRYGVTFTERVQFFNSP